MKQSFDLDNFESFLSEQADRHRMYANDRVWHNIQQSIHGIDRWPALTFASILTLAFFAVVLTISYPNRQLISNQQLSAQVNQLPDDKRVAVSSASKEALILDGQSVASTGISVLQNQANVRTENQAKALLVENKNVVNNNEAGGYTELASPDGQMHSIYTSSRPSEPSIPPTIESQTQSSSLIEFGHLPVSVLSQAKAAPNTSLIASPERYSFNNDLIEKAAEKHFVNTSIGYGPSLPAELNKNQSRWGIQVYATPSISYRYLLEDKKYLDDPSSINGPLAPYLTNSVNQFVRHKPKMGAEIGAAVLYQLSDNLRVKTGLQLNYREYGIEAYATSIPQPAVLALNRGNGIDSLVRYTNISAQSGYKPIELSSNFLQLALPVGFDLRLAQANKVGFYVAASGQLTWQLASNSYLISADYKNYVKQPDLDRRFNINTAIEAFISYDAGGVTWQAGSQIRYQLLPGSTTAYPVREHLVDYGFKVGVVKNLK